MHTSTQQTVKGVRVNCIGDREKCHRPQYEPVQVLITDPIFSKSQQTTSGITARIGLPIFTRQLPPDPLWANSNETGAGGWGFASSTEAAAVHLSCDPDERSDLVNTFGFGWAGGKWQFRPGSFIAVRQDGRALSPLQMEALCGYCRDHAWPLFSHYAGEYYPEVPLTAQEVLEGISKESFLAYCEKDYTKEEMERGGGSASIAGLYGDS
ncbi:hypothetical protein TWF718_002437 [Orbilia javanica]|uniref:Uncharacterized protein n=1 Tax=Orbilia javanica TaxID=47235 RepID=A0AAN8MHP8_9PEZI